MLWAPAEPGQLAQQAEADTQPESTLQDQVQQHTDSEQQLVAHGGERAEAGPDVHVDKAAGVVSIGNLPPGSRYTAKTCRNLPKPAETCTLSVAQHSLGTAWNAFSQVF